MKGWRPTGSVDAARRRGALLNRVRARFESQGVLEVDTPALGYAAGSDPSIESLVVRSELEPERRLFLHTSPEFCMKRLLAAGYPDIFSICRVFRDQELGRRHQPEFTMIEWYRLDFGLVDIVDDACALIGAALDRQDVTTNVDVLDYAQAFQRYAGLDPMHASIDELASSVRADADLRSSLGGNRDAWLNLVMSTRVTPAFANDRLTAVRRFPASQAALARLCPSDPRFADRFEVFLGDLELANGYVELTDPDEQLQRIENDLAVRNKAAQPVNPVDGSLLAALRHGLPACAGVAVGVERLQMVCDQTDDLADVVTFVFGQDHE